MKRSMKKFMVACAAVSAMTVAAGMSAMAAEYSADTNTATYTVPTAADNTQMTVLVIPEGVKGNVQDSDILYINQDEKGGAVNGTAALKTVEGGLTDGTYLVMVGYYDSDNVFQIAEDSFTIGNANPGVDVLIGDVNGNKRIATDDATLVLQHTSGKTVLTGTGFAAAAYCDGSNTRIATSDASEILKYASGKTTEYVGKTVTVTE
jgi:hypothetical protein